MSKCVAMVSGTAWYLWNFRRNVIAGFVADGWRVEVIAGPDDWSDRLADMQGVTVTNWPVSMNGSNPLKELHVFRFLARQLRKARPDFIFNNGIKANVYGGIAARRLNAPYVNNISGLGMRMRVGDWKAKALARLYCYGCARADALLIQNTGDHAFLKTHGLPDIQAIRTMGSGVDLTHFAPSPMPDAPPVKFVFVGRLQDDKGVRDLIEAMRLLNNDATLTVVGDVSHANSGAIPETTRSDWKRDRVAEFTGHQDDVRPFLRNAHALVMPSHGGEGMPKVMLEAAAMGRPVLTSDIDGCRDAIVPGKTGALFPCRDPNGLASALRAFCDLSDADRQAMGSAARAHAEAHFSDQTIVELCLALANRRR